MIKMKGDEEMKQRQYKDFSRNDYSKVMYENLLPHEFMERVNTFPVAYLPLGTLEWHGRHLPFGSDGIQSRGVFQRLAMKVGGVVLPMLFLGPDSKSTDKDGKSYYGMDCHSFEEGQAQQLLGSAYYIDDEQFAPLLDTVMANLSRAGFKVVIGHGHGPSTKAFAVYKQDFAEKHGLLTYNLWELGYDGDEGIQTDHAAANETSLVMAIAPDLVDISQIESDENPVGIWGADPRRFASAREGERLIEKNVTLVAQKLEKILEKIPTPNLSLEYHTVKSLLR